MQVDSFYTILLCTVSVSEGKISGNLSLDGAFREKKNEIALITFRPTQ